MKTNIITSEDRLAYERVRKAIKSERKQILREILHKAGWKILGALMVIVGLIVAVKVTADDAGALLLMILGAMFVVIPKNILFGEDDYYDDYV